MGKVLSVLNRQINKFNVENRAHRVISKEKPSPAPRHPSTHKRLDHLLSETREVRDELMLKHKELDENLRKVYVVSHDVVSQDHPKREKARLPSNRSSVGENELGYEEPETIPEGRITLQQAMKILADHQGDTRKYDVTYISNQYKLAEDDAANFLKFFTSFKIHMPQKLSIKEGEKIKIFLTPADFRQKQNEKEADIKNK